MQIPCVMPDALAFSSLASPIAMLEHRRMTAAYLPLRTVNRIPAGAGWD